MCLVAALSCTLWAQGFSSDALLEGRSTLSSDNIYRRHLRHAQEDTMAPISLQICRVSLFEAPPNWIAIMLG